jgi:hypothetical protein
MSAGGAVDGTLESGDPLWMAPYLTLQAWWSNTAAGIETKATPEAIIADLEARYGVTLPADFRQYLGRGAPSAENWDAEDGNWWPPERIKNIPDEYEHPVSAVVARSSVKRATKLYMPPGGDRFAGRAAWRLGYRSQRVAHRDRPFEKLFRLQRKVGSSEGWEAGIYRPKGMWTRTFERHLDRYLALDAECSHEMAGIYDTFSRHG